MALGGVKFMNLEEELYGWEALWGSAECIVDDIASQWQRLLKDKNLKEQQYHAFLANHAGFFFGHIPSVVISKVKLGDSFEIDFVNVSDQGSLGFSYELVEIETPHIGSTTSSSDYSSRLIHAIKQILEWQIWIEQNRNRALELFPSWSHRSGSGVPFQYTVYIGRRQNDARHVHLRNKLARELDIQIRSFDAFTGHLRRSHHGLVGGEWDELEPIIKNRLNNPFAKAYTHRAWKAIVEDNSFQREAHMFTANWKLLLSQRRYNESNLKKFIRFWSKMPAKQKEIYRKISSH